MLARLRVSPDGRHFVTADGQPFFWLADTAWTLLCHLRPDEVRFYFETRRAQGFNVIQITALNPETNPDLTNAHGIAPFYSTHPLELNPVYFDYLDEILNLAAECGLYIALLPTWGELVTGWTWSGAGAGIMIDERNAHDYGHWLGQRYRDRTNIIWVLGGDRHPVHDSEDYRPVWRALAEGIGWEVTGQVLKWDESHPAWSDVLMTYHTCFTDVPLNYSSSRWLHDDAWLSFHMIQSGHRQHVENYNQIQADYEREPTRPVLDGEPNYEDIPYPIPGGHAYHRDWNVRKRAYWSVLAGACGHTYGHASVWCMRDPARGLEPGTLSWRGALDRPGAQQLLHLRHLVESRPFFECVPDQRLVSMPSRVGGTLDTRLQARLDRQGRFALIYTTSGNTIPVDLSRFAGDTVHSWWFDPRTGKSCDAHGAPITAPFIRLPTTGIHRFQPPTSGPDNDWLLIMDAAEHDFPSPGQTDKDTT
jgi:hypothetical protein